MDLDIYFEYKLCSLDNHWSQYILVGILHTDCRDNRGHIRKLDCYLRHDNVHCYRKVRECRRHLVLVLVMERL